MEGTFNTLIWYIIFLYTIDRKSVVKQIWTISKYFTIHGEQGVKGFKNNYILILFYRNSFKNYRFESAWLKKVFTDSDGIMRSSCNHAEEYNINELLKTNFNHFL